MRDLELSVVIRKLFCFLFIFFCAFPFIKFFSFGGYTQPYALLLGSLCLPISIKVIMRKGEALTFLYFISFAFLGFTLFLLMCFPYGNIQEYKYLTSYIGFPITAVTAIYFAEQEKKLVRILLRISVLIWFFVGFIQFAFDPSFLISIIGLPPEMATDMLVSGRGVLSLAPEPTHYGFHMLMLAAALTLLDEKRRYILLCIFQAIVLAKAASALLALGLGTALAVFATRKVRLHMAFMSLAVIGLTIAAILHFTPQSRVAILLVEFLDNPMEIIHRDVSLNFRLGGLIASFSFIMNDYLLPHGLAHSTWLQSTALIRSANPWLIDISLVGPPSGIGILLFQCGLLILPHIIYMLFAMFSVPTTGWGKIVLYTSIFVIFSQYYIAAPPFALIFGLSLVKRKKPRTWVKGELGQEFEFKQSMVANRIAL